MDATSGKYPLVVLKRVPDIRLDYNGEHHVLRRSSFTVFSAVIEHMVLRYVKDTDKKSKKYVLKVLVYFLIFLTSNR